MTLGQGDRLGLGLSGGGEVNRKGKRFFWRDEWTNLKVGGGGGEREMLVAGEAVG